MKHPSSHLEEPTERMNKGVPPFRLLLKAKDIKQFVNG